MDSISARLEDPTYVQAVLDRGERARMFDSSLSSLLLSEQDVVAGTIVNARERARRAWFLSPTWFKSRATLGALLRAYVSTYDSP